MGCQKEFKLTALMFGPRRLAPTLPDLLQGRSVAATLLRRYRVAMTESDSPPLSCASQPPGDSPDAQHQRGEAQADGQPFPLSSLDDLFEAEEGGSSSPHSQDHAGKAGQQAGNDCSVLFFQQNKLNALTVVEVRWD